MEKLKPLSQGVKLPIQPKPSSLVNSPDKNRLLMLGLQLLTKSLKVPCAVVQPQAQGHTTSSLSTAPVVARDNSPPSSPFKDSYAEVFSGSEDSDIGSPDVNRKRKRVGNNELSETEKREKR